MMRRPIVSDRRRSQTLDAAGLLGIGAWAKTFGVVPMTCRNPRSSCRTDTWQYSAILENRVALVLAVLHVPTPGANTMHRVPSYPGTASIQVTCCLLLLAARCGGRRFVDLPNLTFAVA